MRLQASDSDLGDKIIYAIVSNQLEGKLSNFNPTSDAVTYTSSPGYTGSDSFTFKAVDTSQASSNIAAVSISVVSNSSL